MLQYVGALLNRLRKNSELCCSVLRCVAVCCSVFKCVAVCQRTAKSTPENHYKSAFENIFLSPCAIAEGGVAVAVAVTVTSIGTPTLSSRETRASPPCTSVLAAPGGGIFFSKRQLAAQFAMENYHRAEFREFLSHTAPADSNVI